MMSQCLPHPKAVECGVAEQTDCQVTWQTATLRTPMDCRTSARTKGRSGVDEPPPPRPGAICRHNIQPKSSSQCTSSEPTSLTGCSGTNAADCPMQTPRRLQALRLLGMLYADSPNMASSSQPSLDGFGPLCFSNQMSLAGHTYPSTPRTQVSSPYPAGRPIMNARCCGVAMQLWVWYTLAFLSPECAQCQLHTCLGQLYTVVQEEQSRCVTSRVSRRKKQMWTQLSP